METSCHEPGILIRFSQSQACLVKTRALLRHVGPGDETRDWPQPCPLSPQPPSPFPRARREAGFRPPCPFIGTVQWLPHVQSFRLWGTCRVRRKRNEMPMCTTGKGPGR